MTTSLDNAEKSRSTVTVHTGEDAARVYEQFMQQLMKVFPGKTFDDLSFSREEQTYAARKGNAIGAIATGIDRGAYFDLFRLIADSDARRGAGGADALFDALKSKFTEIQFVAAPYGFVGNQSLERFAERRKAFVTYCESKGFVMKDPDAEDYRMIWRRPSSNV